MTDYRLVRARRKSIAIQVKNAEVVVRAPLRASKTEIDRFVWEKRAWIERHLLAQQRTVEQRESFTLGYGSRVLLCGREYPIVAAEGRVGFDGRVFRLPENLDSTQIKTLMVQVYRMVAETLLPERTRHFAQLMRVRPSAVRVTAAKTRWGSCSGKNSINYSWRLVLAAEDVIDYVVVHELAHIKEHNHSSRFWRIVEDMLPDYRARKKQLRVLQERLSAEGW